MKTFSLYTRYILIHTMAMLLLCLAVSAQTRIVVAKDGTGNFKTIQDAINSLPVHATSQRVIFIRNGIYKEKIFITSDSISLIGEDVEKTQIVFSQARDMYRCMFGDDWGVATINLKGKDITLENLTVLNNYGFDAKGDIQIPCPVESDTALKLVKKTGHQMALRSFETTTRLVVKNCVFRALGGDTVSPWNKEDGMFYFKDCVMEGGVDFYCPRGWSLAENCTFICHSKEAAIWHDGSAHESSKTVLVNCTFTGDDGFKLGRYHRDAQFYLINCRFPQNMADADIFQREANPPNVIKWGKRVYYFNCHRDSGDYEWHKNNFADTLGFNDINPAWVYDYKWNPKKDTANTAVPDSLVANGTSDKIADNMLLYQRKNGGWPKHFQEQKVDYRRELSQHDLKELQAGYNDGIDATIDNEATTREIKYLIKAYRLYKDERYLAAAKKGIDYLFEAQYDNGGWPQFYPDLSSYRYEITYNDNAMINVMNIMQDIVEGKNDFDLLPVAYKGKAEKAVQKGIDCILKTQIRQKKKPTGWCAQYNPHSLQPAPARKFELISISGAESVGIVRFLMRLKDPSQKIIDAVTGAMEWFDKVKIKGYAFVDIKTSAERSGRDRVLVADSSSTIWARFYDMDTNKPFFCGRDGKAKNTVAEIENERRIGYAWYGVWPLKLLVKEYPEWKEKNNKQTIK